MLSLRAALYNLTGNETSPKVRCPFHTVDAMGVLRLYYNPNIPCRICNCIRCGARTRACSVGTRADDRATDEVSPRVATRHARVRAPQREKLRNLSLEKYSEKRK